MHQCSHNEIGMWKNVQNHNNISFCISNAFFLNQSITAFDSTATEEPTTEKSMYSDATEEPTTEKSLYTPYYNATYERK